jgi:hypothetical protein
VGTRACSYSLILLDATRDFMMLTQYCMHLHHRLTLFFIHSICIQRATRSETVEARKGARSARRRKAKAQREPKGKPRLWISPRQGRVVAFESNGSTSIYSKIARSRATHSYLPVFHSPIVQQQGSCGRNRSMASCAWRTAVACASTGRASSSVPLKMQAWHGAVERAAKLIRS